MLRVHANIVKLTTLPRPLVGLDYIIAYPFLALPCGILFYAPFDAPYWPLPAKHCRFNHEFG